MTLVSVFILENRIWQKQGRKPLESPIRSSKATQSFLKVQLLRSCHSNSWLHFLQKHGPDVGRNLMVGRFAEEVSVCWRESFILCVVHLEFSIFCSFCLVVVVCSSSCWRGAHKSRLTVPRQCDISVLHPEPPHWLHSPLTWAQRNKTRGCLQLCIWHEVKLSVGNETVSSSLSS